MEKFILLLLFVELLAFSNGALTRSRKEVEDFESFLRRSAHGKPLTPADEKLMKLQNVWENSGKYQGDIILTEEQIRDKVEQFTGGSKNAILDTTHLWPNKVVYYAWTSSVTSSQRNMIRSAMDDISRNSCVRFVERTASNPTFVSIETKPDGCYAHVGYWPGFQTLLNLAPDGCFYHGIIIHELLHTIGFEHMQCTHNRDDYVRVYWDKIQDGYAYAFDKYSTSQVSNLGETYDYGSIMHYSLYAFSKDGSKTMDNIQPTNEEIGQINGLSSRDISKIRKLYQC